MCTWEVLHPAPEFIQRFVFVIKWLAEIPFRLAEPIKFHSAESAYQCEHHQIGEHDDAYDEEDHDIDPVGIYGFLPSSKTGRSRQWLRVASASGDEPGVPNRMLKKPSARAARVVPGRSSTRAQ